MITKIVFNNLSTSISYLGIGGIRFYDRDGILIESGVEISKGLQAGETENIKVSVNANAYSSAYYPINLIDTSLSQTDKYFLTKTKNNVSIEFTFKKIVESISKIEYVAFPVNNGKVNDFTIDVYDESGVVTQTYSASTSTTLKEVEDITTYELISYYITDSYQSVVTTDETSVKNINRIVKIEVIHDEPENTTIRYLVSTDDRTTWKVYKGGQWIEIDDLSDENVITNGMNKDELESIKEDFQINLNFDIRAVMVTDDIEKVPILKQIRVIH